MNKFIKYLRLIPPRRIRSIYITVAISEFSTSIATPLITFLFFSNTSNLLPQSMSDSTRALYFAMFISIYKVAGMASNPVFGTISDLFGRKKVFFLTALGALLFSLTTVFGIIFQNLFIFIMGACVFAFSWALKAVASAAISDVSLRSQKIKNLSLMQFSIGIGVSLGPIFSGYLGDVVIFGYSYIFAFIVLGIFSIILLLSLFGITIAEFSSMGKISLNV